MLSKYGRCTSSYVMSFDMLSWHKFLDMQKPWPIRNIILWNLVEVHYRPLTIDRLMILRLIHYCIYHACWSIINASNSSRYSVIQIQIALSCIQWTHFTFSIDLFCQVATCRIIRSILMELTQIIWHLPRYSCKRTSHIIILSDVGKR